eukprot:scaffold148_cov341-Pavlova_lutheri.AAC.25
MVGAFHTLNPARSRFVRVPELPFRGSPFKPSSIEERPPGSPDGLAFSFPSLRFDSSSPIQSKARTFGSSRCSLRLGTFGKQRAQERWTWWKRSKRTCWCWRRRCAEETAETKTMGKETNVADGRVCVDASARMDTAIRTAKREARRAGRTPERDTGQTYVHDGSVIGKEGTERADQGAKPTVQAWSRCT